MKKLFLSVAAVVVIACSPRIKSSGSTVQPAESAPAASAEPVPDVMVVGPMIQTEQQGKSLFDNHCGKCHNHPSPTEYTKEQWVPIMQRMRIEARLTEHEGNQVYDYIASLAK